MFWIHGGGFVIGSASQPIYEGSALAALEGRWRRATVRGRLVEAGWGAALGGGTGQSTLLRGLKEVSSNITAVVTVADDGGSSGKLRTELGVPPVGDIRNCIAALADAEPAMGSLMQYRFPASEDEPGVAGHALGNLLIAAMADITGDSELSSSMKSPKYESSDSPIGRSSEIGCLLIFITRLASSTLISAASAISSIEWSRTWRRITAVCCGSGSACR